MTLSVDDNRPAFFDAFLAKAERDELGLLTCVMEIGPASAAEIMAYQDELTGSGRVNPNRRPSPKKLRSYTRQMETDRWHITGEPISFASDFCLINGQHRLMSIAKSGISVKFRINADLPDNLRGVMDDNLVMDKAGKLRQRHGIDCGKRGVAMAEYLGRRHGWFPDDGPEPFHTAAIIREYGALIDVSMRLTSSRTAGFTVGSRAGLGCALWHADNDPEKIACINEIIEVISTNDPIAAYQAGRDTRLPLQLRDILMNSNAKGMPRSVSSIALERIRFFATQETIRMYSETRRRGRIALPLTEYADPDHADFPFPLPKPDFDASVETGGIRTDRS